MAGEETGRIHHLLSPRQLDTRRTCTNWPAMQHSHPASPCSHSTSTPHSRRITVRQIMGENENRKKSKGTGTEQNEILINQAINWPMNHPYIRISTSTNQSIKESIKSSIKSSTHQNLYFWALRGRAIDVAVRRKWNCSRSRKIRWIRSPARFAPLLRHSSRTRTNKWEETNASVRNVFRHNQSIDQLVDRLRQKMTNLNLVVLFRMAQQALLPIRARAADSKSHTFGVIRRLVAVPDGHGRHVRNGGDVIRKMPVVVVFNGGLFLHAGFQLGGVLLVVRHDHSYRTGHGTSRVRGLEEGMLENVKALDVSGATDHHFLPRLLLTPCERAFPGLGTRRRNTNVGWKCPKRVKSQLRIVKDADFEVRRLKNVYELLFYFFYWHQIRLCILKSRS